MSSGAPRRGRGRPSPEDAVAIEEDLLAVALKEFLQHGYGGASMARIVKRAGMSKTTLYSRFSSKEELFLAVAQRSTRDLAAWALLESDASALSLTAVLEAYANHMLGLNLRGDLLAINQLIQSESLRFPELGAAVKARIDLGIARVSRFIADRAVIDGIPCRNPDAVASVFIYMISGWYVIASTLSEQPVSEAERERWIASAVHTLVASRADW